MAERDRVVVDPRNGEPIRKLACLVDENRVFLPVELEGAQHAAEVTNGGLKDAIAEA